MVVDDIVMNLRMAEMILKKSGYRVLLSGSGTECLKLLERESVDMILLDIEMPGMDGKEVARLIKANRQWEKIPIIFLTADSDPATEVECLQLGADDFITKPFAPKVMERRVARVLELYELRYDLEAQLKKKTKQIELVTLNSVMSIANTIDAKDKYTSGHSIRVAKCAVEIARHLGWDEAELQNFRYAALLHDIGKIGVPDSVLNKPGRLTDEEFEIIKKHPVIGGDILKDIHTIDHVQEGALMHHERYDGKGYPYGLKGEEIPLYARIIGLADSYDAMTSDRVYRKRLSDEQVIAEFERCRGSQFDPNLTDVFIKMLREGFHIEYTDAHSGNVSVESDPLLNKVPPDYTAEVKNISATDALTGLCNRNYMESRVAELLCTNHKGALFILDLDNFKYINDTYGHIVGDKTLQMFADVLKANSTDSDVVCRIGGDEFTVFFTDMAQQEEAQQKAEAIIQCIEETFKNSDYTQAMSVSIGIAFYPQGGEDFQKLYQNADKALYYIKNNGKNAYHIYTKNKEEITGKHMIADLDNVRRLLEGKMDISKGTFHVAYEEFQKIYDFMSRYVKRNQNNVQLALLTLRMKDEEYPDSSILEGAMDALKTAIVTSLRGSDVGTKYSSSQYIIMLMDVSSNDGVMVLERVVKRFHELYQREDLTLIYDLQALGTKGTI
jgi:diguanylate cyclase (GGDEF)-like protein/putative nucleotidyltransferase with HDIG domain